MTDAIAAITRTLRTLADGTVRLQLDFEPRDRTEAMALFGEPGASVAIARLNDEAALTQLQKEGGVFERSKKADCKSVATGFAGSNPAASTNYGQHAQQLWKSTFFTNPKVWRAIGTDAEFLAWCRAQGCAFCKAPAPSQAAPVRRMARRGAEEDVKPEYSAIPICINCHHTHYARGEKTKFGDEWMEEQRVTDVKRWAWETLKTQLGYESWKDVPPEVFEKWKEERLKG